MPDIKTVLCPLDLVDSELEVNLAAQICTLFGSRLVLHHNVSYDPPLVLANTWMYSETHWYPEAQRIARAEDEIQKLTRTLAKSLSVEGRVTLGQVDESIISLAGQLPADLIVMGTHTPTGERHSHTDFLLTHSPCPLLTTRLGDSAPKLAEIPPLFGDVPTVIVPLDFSWNAVHALEYILALKEIWPLHLHVIHVESQHALKDLRGLAHLDWNEQRLARQTESLARMKRLVPARFQDSVEFRVLVGDAADQILDYSRQVGASFVLMGAHPKNFADSWLFGSTAKKVLHSSSCPVWLVPTGTTPKPTEAGSEAADQAKAKGTI